VHRRLSGATAASLRLPTKNRQQAKICKVSACDSATSAASTLEPITQDVFVELTMLHRVM